MIAAGNKRSDVKKSDAKKSDLKKIGLERVTRKLGGRL